MMGITFKTAAPAPLKKGATAPQAKAPQPKKAPPPKVTPEMLADAYKKAVEYRAAHPQPALGMGDHAFWANPASYWKMADSSFWANPDSYRGHGR